MRGSVRRDDRANRQRVSRFSSMSEVHENTAEPQTIKVVDLRPDAKDFNITIKVGSAPEA